MNPHSKDTYLNDCEKLTACTESLYTLQKNLLQKLLNNDDGNESTPSSRKMFINKLRKYVVENSVEHRTIYFLEGRYASPTQPAVALSFLCILLDVLRSLFEVECPNKNVLVVPKTFYDGSLKYFHFDRIGGVLTHLQRHYRQELMSRLGDDFVAEDEDDPLNGIYNGVELSDICMVSSIEQLNWRRLMNCFRFAQIRPCSC